MANTSEYLKAWRKANPEKCRRNRRNWYRANPDKAKAKRKRWYLKNHARQLAYHREYYSFNSWRWREYRLVYFSKNPEISLFKAGMIHLTNDMVSDAITPFDSLALKEEVLFRAAD